MINHEQLDSPDFRSSRADMLVKVLDRYDGLTAMDTPQERLTHFRSLGPDGFVQQLTSLNRIITQKHSAADREHGFLVQYDTVIAYEDNSDTYLAMPSLEDKEPLLHFLYDLTSDMASQPDASIDHIAAVVGVGINAIHPFDATGRTARAAYHLLASPADKREGVLKAASEDSRQNTIQLSPESFEEPLFGDMKLKIGSHYQVEGELRPHVVPGMELMPFDGDKMKPGWTERTPEEVGAMQTILNDPHLAEIVPFLYSDGLSPQAKQQLYQKYGDQEVFRMDIFANSAPTEEIEILSGISKKIRSSYVQKLLQIISDKGSQATIYARTKERGVIEIPASDFVTLAAKNELTVVDYFA